MKINTIPLEALTAAGKISLTIDDGELQLASKRVLDKNAGYSSVPSAFRLPFRIDMLCKANSSDFRLQIGKGWVHFSAPINHSGGGIRRADILTGKEELPKSDYDHDFPLQVYVPLSIVYGDSMTWVEIDNKYCYSTSKAPYLSEPFTDRLNIKISCGRDVVLLIKSLTITEYENKELDIPTEIANRAELTPFEWYIKSLPHELRDEAQKTDEYILKNLKSSLKCKRGIDKYGNVLYTSPCGFQYKMRKFSTTTQPEDAEQHESGKHEISWATGWTADSVMKPDHTIQILDKLAASSPAFAQRIFSRLKICGNAKCKRNSILEYAGIVKGTCSSSILFEWLSSEFEEVRKVAEAASEVINLS